MWEVDFLSPKILTYKALDEGQQSSGGHWGEILARGHLTGPEQLVQLHGPFVGQALRFQVSNLGVEVPGVFQSRDSSSCALHQTGLAAHSDGKCPQTASRN